MLANEVIQRDMQNMQQLQGQLDNLLVKLQENRQQYNSKVNRYTTINPKPTGKNYFVNNGNLRNKAYYGEKDMNGNMTFKEYPSSMIDLSYSIYKGYDSSPGQHDIYQCTNTRICQNPVHCEKQCFADPNCDGFVHAYGYCFFKSKVYPNTWRTNRGPPYDIYKKRAIPKIVGGLDPSCAKSMPVEAVSSSFVEKGTIVPGYMTPKTPCMLSKVTLDNRQWEQGWNAEILVKGNEIVGKLKGLVKKKALMKKMRTEEKERILKSIETYEEIVRKNNDRDARIITVAQRAKDMALNVGVEHFHYLSLAILLVSILIAMIFIMRKKS